MKCSTHDEVIDILLCDNSKSSSQLLLPASTLGLGVIRSRSVDSSDSLGLLENNSCPSRRACTGTGTNGRRGEGDGDGGG